MKQVQSIVSRLVQRIAAKSRRDAKVSQERQPVELDARSLKHVAGGDGSAQTPNKGW